MIVFDYFNIFTTSSYLFRNSSKSERWTDNSEYNSSFKLFTEEEQEN